ncbi:MAG: HEAT repeat domain-containing protein [Alphaproteobacteria bacterium]|nr:HEAT repeat domain-containing protein [Alphaproteobacteria bacterium]
MSTMTPQERRPRGDGSQDPAARAVGSLARLVRSLGLYDLRNQAMVRFIEQYRRDMLAALAHHRGLEIEVHPFELVHEGRVVYVERERERSLAFRLFRDGARRLIIDQDATWRELILLVEIVGISAPGVVATDSDLVTRLSRDDLPSIKVEAVDGIVQAETMTAMGSAAPGAEPAVPVHMVVPAEWDLPIPPLLEPVRLVHRGLTRDRVEALLDEAEDAMLPRVGLRLVEEVVAAILDPADPFDVSDAAHVFAELRDFLLSEGYMRAVTRMLELLMPLQAAGVDGADDVLAGFAGPEVLDALLQLALSPRSPPMAEIRGMLDALPGEHLDHVVRAVRSQDDAIRQRVLCDLLGTWAGSHGTALLELMPELAPGAAERIAVALLRRGAVAPLRVGIALARATVDAERSELAARIISESEPVADIGPELEVLVDHDHPAVRRAALETLGRLGAPASLPVLRGAYERLDAAAALGDAEAVGRALGRVADAELAHELEERLRPRSWWRRLFHVPPPAPVEIAAVTALATLDLRQHGRLVRWLANSRPEPVRSACQALLREEGA